MKGCSEVIQRLCHIYAQVLKVIENAVSNKELVVKVVDQTPINLWDYVFTFFITVFGAFVGGWFAFRFNRKQEKKKQDYDDMVERIEKIYVPLCMAIEKLMREGYGRDTGDYGEPSIFVMAQDEWRDYRKSLRTLFLAQNRRLMLQDELVELKAFYEQTEALNAEWEEAFYEMATSYEENDEKCLLRQEAILDIACYDGSHQCRPLLSTNQGYIEAITSHAPILNGLFLEYVDAAERIYRDYLGENWRF